MSKLPNVRLERHGAQFDAIPHSVSADPTVPLEQKALCAILMSFSMGKRHCDPSLASIGAMAGLGPKQVGRIIGSMENRGLITVERTTGDSNVYDLQPMWCWAPPPKMSLVNATEVVLESSEARSEDGDHGHICTPKENTLYLGTKVQTVVEEVPGTKMSVVGSMPQTLAGFVDAYGRGDVTLDDVPEHMREHVCTFAIPF